MLLLPIKYFLVFTYKKKKVFPCVRFPAPPNPYILIKNKNFLHDDNIEQIILA